MAQYWKDPHWIVQAEKAEEKAKLGLKLRRWTDRDTIVEDYVIKHDWPTIPDGEKFAGEKALRVFFKVEDFSKPETDPDRVVVKPADNAVLVSTVSIEDARRADIVDAANNDAPLIPVLVVPVKFFVWVAGALGFDKKVLLSLSRPIMEHCLEHDDAEIWPEIVWITPMKEEDRKYRYAVLPLVGMGGVIDPQKGNPSLYAPLQTDPYRHFVWDIIDEVMDGGTSAWGQGATGGDGAATIFAIKLRLVNFLRDLADAFAEEEFERAIRRGEFDRGSVAKAISNGLFRHLPDPERIVRENEWLERADEVGRKRAEVAFQAFRSYGLGGAASAIARGVGEGWGDPLEEAKRRVGYAALCKLGDYLTKAAALELLGKVGELGELAEEGLLKGDIPLAYVDEIDKDHELSLSGEEFKKLLTEWLRDLDQHMVNLRP